MVSYRKILEEYTAVVESYGLTGLRYGQIVDGRSVSGPLSKLCEAGD